MKILLNIIGFIFIALGVVGIVLPLLPTTPFAVAAAAVFAKANPKMRVWLFKNRFLGPYLKQYYEKTGLTVKYKARTILFLWFGLISSMIIIELFWLYFVLCGIGVCVSIHILLIKTKRD